MDRENERTVYIQRYETFRHLDRLRWQVPTITFAGATVFLGLSVGDTEPLPPWWAWLVFTVLSVLSWYVVWRIRKGIHKNHKVLEKFGAKIGDVKLQKPKKKYGASWWLMVFFISQAFLGVIIALLQLRKII